jgi:hypothetical protein
VLRRGQIRRAIWRSGRFHGIRNFDASDSAENERDNEDQHDESEIGLSARQRADQRLEGDKRGWYRPGESASDEPLPAICRCGAWVFSLWGTEDMKSLVEDEAGNRESECNEPRYSPLIFSRYFCAVFSGCLPVLVPTVRHVSVGRDRILVGVGKLRIPGE